MKIKILPFFLSIIFFIIFFIFYKGLQNSSIYTPDASIEKDIPSFEAKLFNTNKKMNYEDTFKNDKYYLINIWASWCVPCREEHSFLMDLNNQKNLEIIGINYKDKKQSAEEFLKQLGSPYDIILLDENGTIAIEWGAYGVPETFLIYNKKIIKKIIGPLNKDLFLEIKKLIK